MNNHMEEMAANDVARLAKLSRGRIAQMDSAGEMPAADAPGSTASRRKWQRRTIERWLVAQGRRPDWNDVNWLIPGPDGPQLELRERQMLTARGAENFDRFNGGRELRVHVRTYVDRVSRRRLWLVTPVLPAESWQLVNEYSWAQVQREELQHKRPVDQLINKLYADYAGHPDSRLLGTVVILPGPASAPGRTWHEEPVRTVDVTRHRDTLEVSDADIVWSGDLLPDLVQALGHRLPLWPPGCATAELVAIADPARPAPRSEIPPTMEDAWRYHQLCYAAAERAPAEIAPLLTELGRTYWHSKTPDWATTERGIPSDYNQRVWALAIDAQLPDIPRPENIDWFPGLSWLLGAGDVSTWLADNSATYFGDPDSVGVAVLDLTSLPAAVAEVLGCPGAPADTDLRSYRSRRVQDALDQYGPATVDRWPAAGGVDWRARVGDRVAVHIPRHVPAPQDIGEWLDLTITLDLTGKAVGIITTVTGAVAFLPSLGNGSGLSMAIQHALWHPGLPTSIVGVWVDNCAADLEKAVEAMIGAGSRAVPWRQLATLAAEHSDHCLVTGCPRRPGQPRK